MLYIPVESDYNTPVSLKRSLSDPEIYFPNAVRHSLIFAVNGIIPHEKMSIYSASASKVNIQSSPSHSLGSISGDSKDLEPPALGDNFAGIPFLIVPPSPVRARRVSFSYNSIKNKE